MTWTSARSRFNSVAIQLKFSGGIVIPVDIDGISAQVNYIEIALIELDLMAMGVLLTISIGTVTIDRDNLSAFFFGIIRLIDW